jgi:hypothetical protein
VVEGANLEYVSNEHKLRNHQQKVL